MSQTFDLPVKIHKHTLLARTRVRAFGVLNAEVRFDFQRGGADEWQESTICGGRQRMDCSPWKMH